ncbi:transcription elongation factor [Diplocarpon rosae]|nr:transcription elongation factor [Diplocarpon rosae]
MAINIYITSFTLPCSCAKQVLALRICTKPAGRSKLHIMGKRKKAAKKPVGPKKNAPLPSNFDCLFCNHVSSVSVKLDKKAGVGALACKVCSQHFQCSINYLSAAVDVYSDWVDACDAVAKDDGDAADYGHGSEARVPPVGRPRGRGREEEEDGDGLIDDADASDDGRGAYGGEGVVADDDEY